jgi:flagellar basal-body rod protein FlgC
MSIDVSASGMTAQRIRLSVLANNIANASTTRTPEGGPYRPRYAVFEEVSGSSSPGGFARTLDEVRGQIGQGVRVRSVVQDNTDNAFIRVYDPSIPMPVRTDTCCGRTSIRIGHGGCHRRHPGLRSERRGGQRL